MAIYNTISQLGGGGGQPMSSIAGGITPGQGALGAGVLGLLGSGLGTYFQNKSNKKAARTQRKWLQRQSNRVYQKTMRDMKHAGLNPILAGQMGGNTVSSSAVPHLESMGKEAPQTGLAAKRLAEEMNVIRATAKNTNTNTQRMGTEMLVNLAQVKKINQETITSGMNARAIELQTALNHTLIPGAINAESMEQSTFGKWMHYVNRLGGGALGTALRVFTKGKGTR